MTSFYSSIPLIRLPCLGLLVVKKLPSVHHQGRKDCSMKTEYHDVKNMLEEGEELAKTTKDHLWSCTDHHHLEILI